MIDDLRSFLERATVVELFASFALASAVVGFANSVITGLVISPIISGDGNRSSFEGLSLAIFGRSFQFEPCLVYGLVLLAIGALTILLVRRSEGALWNDRAVKECPHCLSDIPAEARVCAYCTRDQT